MKIRQYTAPTMQEAILKIKVDLGPNAVILHTRKFKKGGMMGMFGQDMVEVLAAVDPVDGKDKQGGNGRQNDNRREREASTRSPLAQPPEGIDLGPLTAPVGGSTGGDSPRKSVSRDGLRDLNQPIGDREAQQIARELLAAAGLTGKVDKLAQAEQQQGRAPAYPPPGYPDSLPASAPPRQVDSSSARVVYTPEGQHGGWANPQPSIAPQVTYAEAAPVAVATSPVMQAPAATDAMLGTSLAALEQALKGKIEVQPEGQGRLADEVSDLKETVADLRGMVTALVGKLEMQPRTALQFPTLLQRIYDKLLSLDMDPSVARGMVVYLQKEQPHLKTYEDLCDALETPLGSLFNVAGPINPVVGERTIVALVGPTGVGKTTTIAKLAANFTLSQQIDMALLTIDTYRVAAIEQLKTYGDIIGLPVEVVLTPATLKEALKQHADKGLILIDTAGRSPYNRLHINELRSFLDVEPRIETHLVLSATTRLADLKQIVKHFTSTGVDRLVFSKTDETDVLGGVISIAHETGLPVSYLTTGQSVPDDIMVADGPALAKMFVTQLKA